MERIDNSRFLLYIEPNSESKSQSPLNDGIVDIMELALSEARVGTGTYFNTSIPEYFEAGGYKGFHTTDCGKCSDNHDYLLKNGMITNSLCTFYLRYYRDYIPVSEMEKVNKLVEFYKKNVG